MLTKCCCCLSLRTAGLVMGGLQVVGSILNLIVYSVMLNEPSEVERRGEFIGSESVVQLSKGVLITIIVMSLINLLTSVLLIVGTVKNRHKLLLPWLIVGVIYFIITVLWVCVTIYSLIAASAEANTFILLIALGLAIAFNYYCLYAIYSLYKEIQVKRSPVPMQTRFTHV